MLDQNSPSGVTTSNTLPSNTPPPDEMWTYVKSINARLDTLEHRASYVVSAFPKNDLGRPDYDGHRKSHLELIEQNKVVSGYKSDVTKTVLSVLAGVVLSLIGSGILQALKG